MAAKAGFAPFAKAAVVGECGGVEYDGDGTITATESCWINANRNPAKTKARIETEPLLRFGATKMIWVSPEIKGQDVTDDHVDSTSRFVRPGVVMVQVPPADRTDIWAQDARTQLATLQQATDAQGRSLQVLTVEGPRHAPSVADEPVGDVPRFVRQLGRDQLDGHHLAVRRHGEGGGGAHCVTMQEPSP